ncbi:polysaccharide deacetylase family protein [Myroides pelagicus]|uniref:Polysaccharide deacetylase family protein n=1 Tax=Myroides pelagicus TaxID=270914 RepID=A0A7K1GLB4_9FLAO|nr:polysaccharide deacetylase family protein [Myroides pelagicus]MTH29530.1 polysaccharide deacetylase family protein [Myroides pelagicus]
MNLSHHILPFLFPTYTWLRKTKDKKVYLTFDDGPIPEITEWVLDTLAQYQIKATFFCIGDNIRKHPTIFQRIVKEGHQIGNHTFNHLNGWKTPTEVYLDNIMLCEEQIALHSPTKTFLLRPPYGKITRKQAKELQHKGYEIIMWHNVTKDYDQTITPKQCLVRGLKNIKKGSIIVFHDSIKAQKNLQTSLPQLIESILAKGYHFDIL